jgi:sugar lactone lactonase YvrE
LLAAACADDAPGPDPAVCSRGTPELAVTTLAGCELPGDADGPRTDVRFRNPTNVVIDAGGGVFVADFDNSRLRRVEPDGVTSTIVVRDDFTAPFGLAFAADGSLFVETDDNDQGVHSLDSGTIWRVNTATGEAVVVARDLGRPRGLAVLPDGRIAMADHMHHVVSILDPATGIETPLAGMQDLTGFANGSGTEARFAQPYDLVLLPDGDLAVSDQDNHRIRRVTLAGVVSDLAGSDTIGSTDGPVDTATFDAPQALAVGPDGLYVTDIRSFLIRRIANGIVDTIAGDGTRGFIDADEPRSARFSGVEGMAADASRLVIADGNRGDGSTFHRIRIVDLNAVP